MQSISKKKYENWAQYPQINSKSFTKIAFLFVCKILFFSLLFCLIPFNRLLRALLAAASRALALYICF